MLPRGALYSHYDVPPCGLSMTEIPQAAHGSFFLRKIGRKTSSAPRHEEGIVAQDQHSERPLTAYKKRRDSSRGSLSSLTDLTQTIRARSSSVRSKTAANGESDAAILASSTSSPDKKIGPSFRPSLGVSAFPKRQQSSESVDNAPDAGHGPRPPSSADTKRGLGLGGGYGLKREDSFKPPSTSHGTSSRSESQGQNSLSGTTLTNGSQPGSAIVAQHIQDLSLKRISTLSYLRKAHEGRVFWFNTLEFKKRDLSRMSYFDPQKLVRRANNYLILGLSIPMVLEPQSNSLADYLRIFNLLLTEFESYQQIHPPDGSSSSSLSRARIPQMFKRAGGGKNRRTSDAVSPMIYGDIGDGRSLGGITGIQLASSDRDLLPGEEYQYLLTPNLPFEPDYFQTFATLCDVLIDSYTRIVSLVGGPETEPLVGLSELFQKVDSKVRKILVAGVVREFEENTKQGIRSEISGISKLTLGGLI